MITENQIEDLMGRDVYDADGDKLGSAGQVYLDDETGRPEWLTVKTGLFGMKESFVPLASAELSGERLTVPYGTDVVKDAPNVDPEGGHLSHEEEDRLYRHYGLDTGQSAGWDTGEGVAGRDRGEGAAGRDTSASGKDDAMTRSEEQLNVGTQTRETGKARLRKYVTTEQQSVTVPVTREEVRVEREPITDANRDEAVSGPDISEAEHEVTLREERPVVEKETVPVERVRLEKDQVTDQEQVTEDVRKERIETEGAESENR